ncbi:MAG: hypothetical protein FJX76_01720 [Armatimonadetes bacterium]|nr:hypothetical protein [Armatimonadota bacterium]
MMKRVVALVGAVVLFGGSGARAESDLGDAFVQAGPAARQQLREMVRTEYLGLAEKLLDFVTARDRKFFTQAALSRLDAILARHPEAVSTLPAKVMEDLHARYPRLVTQIVLTAMDVEPGVVGQFSRWRAKDAVRKMVADKYPRLVEDALAVIKEKSPTLPAAVRRTAMETALSADPTLHLEVLLDAARVARTQGGLQQFLGGRTAFRKALADNPKMARALVAMIDEKYSERIYRVAHAVVWEVGKQHGAAIAGTVREVVKLVDARYPALASEVIRLRITQRQAVVSALRAQHPKFAKQMADAMQEKYPRLLADAVASIDRNAPGLRDDLRSAMAQRFPGLHQDVRAMVAREFPGLLEKTEAILK